MNKREFSFAIIGFACGGMFMALLLAIPHILKVLA